MEDELELSVAWVLDADAEVKRDSDTMALVFFAFP